MTVAYLDSVGTALLDAAAGGLALATTGRVPPSAQFLSHGPPAGDHCCDGGELAVWLESVDAEDFGASISSASSGQIPQYGCAVIWLANYVISLQRCVPIADAQGNAPSAADLDTSAADLLADLWAILTELVDRLKATTLIPGQDQNCKNVTLTGVQVAEPTGGCGGWEIRLTVRCNDPGPVGS